MRFQTKVDHEIIRSIAYRYSVKPITVAVLFDEFEMLTDNALRVTVDDAMVSGVSFAVAVRVYNTRFVHI